MNKKYLIDMSSEFTQSSQENFISKEIAMSENVIDLKIFDAPILAFGAAEDENFKLLKEPGVIGDHYKLPTDWLPTAKTVISFFFPFTEEVVVSNRKNNQWPSEGWLHGRIEGQKFLNKFAEFLKNELISEGYDSIVPVLDKRFWTTTVNVSDPSKSFTSNWSERHAGFVCGLGTFGLSKGLITKKGIAGRLVSIVTELYLEPDVREYKEIYEYCTMCGACVKKCPVEAISLENGKDHKTCSDFVDTTQEKFNPRYGCGKCQVSVPCERRIPRKA